MTSPTVFLPSSAMSQLNQLKAANNIAINKIDARRSDVNKQSTAASGLKTEADQLKDALGKLSSATDKKAAVETFVKEYNDLFKAVKTQTAKGATLSRAFDIRTAQSNLREPFLSPDVLSSMRALGIESTREGLKVSGEPDPTANMTTFVNAFQSTVDKVQARIDSFSSRVSQSLERLDKEKERVSERVERMNKRTELSFLKMYQVMQAASNANGSNSSGGVSIFG